MSQFQNKISQIQKNFIFQFSGLVFGENMFCWFREFCGFWTNFVRKQLFAILTQKTNHFNEPFKSEKKSQNFQKKKKSWKMNSKVFLLLVLLNIILLTSTASRNYPKNYSTWIQELVRDVLTDPEFWKFRKLLQTRVKGKTRKISSSPKTRWVWDFSWNQFFFKSKTFDFFVKLFFHWI